MNNNYLTSFYLPFGWHVDEMAEVAAAFLDSGVEDTTWLWQGNKIKGAWDLDTIELPYQFWVERNKILFYLSLYDI